MPKYKDGVRKDEPPDLWDLVDEMQADRRGAIDRIRSAYPTLCHVASNLSLKEFEHWLAIAASCSTKRSQEGAARLKRRGVSGDLWALLDEIQDNSHEVNVGIAMTVPMLYYAITTMDASEIDHWLQAAAEELGTTVGPVTAPPAQKREISDYQGFSTNPDLSRVGGFLKSSTSVRAAAHRLSELFVLVFREHFAQTMPGFALSDDPVGVARTDWTYHVALAVRRTAEVLGLSCRFEGEGRFDGIIETLEDRARPVLLAEWEWEYQSVLGDRGELEKLRRGTQRLEGADALLLTYAPAADYLEFVRSIVDGWQSKSSETLKSTLFLVVILYQESRGVRLFSSARTVEITSAEVVLWDDIPV